MRLSAQADSINVPGDNSTASTSNMTVASIFQCQPCGEGLRCPFSSAVENLVRGGAPAGSPRVGFVSNSINRKGNDKICAICFFFCIGETESSLKNKKRNHSFSLSYCVRKRVAWNFSKTGWSTSHSTRKTRRLSLARSVHARAEIHAWDSGRLRVGSRWANEDLQVPARCELTFGCQGDTESFSSHSVPCIVCKVCPCHDGLIFSRERLSAGFFQ